MTLASYYEEDGKLIVKTETSDEVIFGRKLRLARTLEVSLEDNSFQIEDRIYNTGDRKEPIEILYHMNMGYPLLDEESIVTIPSSEVIARDDHAKEDIANWAKMEKPQAGYLVVFYYCDFGEIRSILRKLNIKTVELKENYK